MTAKRILLVGMLDSVHVGRWVSQFEGLNYNFTLFPSKKFRTINNTLSSSLTPNSRVKARLANRYFTKRYAGYLDYLIYVIPSRFGLKIREWHLGLFIKFGRFDYIHALEIQGAGYLVDESLKMTRAKHQKVILTNWGSDIYYFVNFPDHKLRIQSALASANFYSAECHRDYKLAQELGFSGAYLPCIPNAGGFKLNKKSTRITSKRKQIIVKCYGGQFGRGKLIVDVLMQILPTFKEYSVFLYSVTGDLIPAVLELSSCFPKRVRFTSQSNPLTHEELMMEFNNSRVYVGASVSDGISTSFLEALVHGCYPIQTNSSCASEWLSLGVIGSTPSVLHSELKSSLELSLCEDKLVDAAQTKNMQVANEYLEFNKVRGIAIEFYNS